MDIKLHNTLTGTTEVFQPLQSGAVSMYHCGPTVYDRAHVGNLRSYVFADTLRRVCEYNGYKVHQVINITDVGHLSSDADDGEDKMTKALNRLGKPLSLAAMREVGTTYFEAFKNDLGALNIEPPQEFPRATDTIDDDVNIIKILVDKGYAYRTTDGLYFDIAKFPAYGKLGGIKLSEQRDGARVQINAEKRQPADFALWKLHPTLGWDSPWGKGFPGWHIECSAMSRKYLGQPFDIHTGGIDHIPTHHNNEIAQSEAAFGMPLARYWLHNAFITMPNGKMAKSLGNSLTLSALADMSISPLAFRYWLLTAHYRSPVQMSLEAIRAAQQALIRLLAVASERSAAGGQIHSAYRQKFLSAVNDDLNLPQAVAILWELIKDRQVSDADTYATMLDFDRVLGLDLAHMPRIAAEDIPLEIKALADARQEARLSKDWTKADALRLEIESRGFNVKDTAEGYDVRPR
ncbi:MAG: cysteine--tRNA ligase [Patescibacteria group bacterium]|nr:cysteine--tRNA ligase [Patescibacteria group bacterium]MDE2172577.1 cysteine--tRNA ligase [Patescibacteria group bacterium]